MKVISPIVCQASPLALVSIITVVFNGVDSIEKTIEASMDQTYGNVEYIIIDGGSTDGTIEVIKRYEEKINYCSSENDRGIADAMNKGLKVATGQYVIFMNCGDYFLNNDSLSDAMLEIEDYQILMCGVLYGNKDNVVSPRGFNYWMNFKTGVLHQGGIVQRDVFNKIGGFDIQFKIALDYDFFLRAYLHNVKAKKSEVILSFMDDMGVSAKDDKESLLLRLNEEKLVQEKNCQSGFMRRLYKVYWLLYMTYKKGERYINV